MKHLLLKPKWLLMHLLVISIAVLFVNLGFWQLRRLEQRRAHNALITQRMAAAPEPLEQLLERYSPGESGAVGDALAYRRAVARGNFDAANEVLLRNRSYQGQPGWHLLTPLVLAEGSAILVDRGWVPYQDDTPPIADARPPAGQVEVTGFLLSAQRAAGGGFGPRDPPEGKLQAVFYVDGERLEQQLPYALEPVYLQLEEQSPAAAGGLPILPAPPALTEGPHLSYALQWFSFALIGLIGYVALMRRELLGRQGA